MTTSSSTSVHGIDQPATSRHYHDDERTTTAATAATTAIPSFCVLCLAASGFYLQALRGKRSREPPRPQWQPNTGTNVTLRMTLTMVTTMMMMMILYQIHKQGGNDLRIQAANSASTSEEQTLRRADECHQNLDLKTQLSREPNTP